MSRGITPETVLPEAIVFKGTGSGRAGREFSRKPDVLPLTLGEVQAKRERQQREPSYVRKFLETETNGGGVMGFVALMSLS